MLRFSILIFFSLSIGAVFSQSTPQLLEPIIAKAAEDNPNVGLSVGYISNGKSYFFNHGQQMRESKKMVDEHTVFEIGSITKLFTAHLIAQLMEKETISSDATIDEYLPEQFVLNNAITEQIKITDLASHQSGLPDFDFAKLIQVNPSQPLNEINPPLVDSILRNTNDLNDYGAYRYSNISFALLGLILEKTHQTSFEEILRQEILAPAKMHESRTSDFQANEMAQGYQADGKPAEAFHWNGIIASAGLLKSSTTDLLQFIDAFLLSEKYKSVNQRIQTTYFKNTFIELGMGLNILRENGHTIYVKTGDTLGQTSVLAYCPEKQFGLVILSNQAGGHARSLYSDLIQVILK